MTVIIAWQVDLSAYFSWTSLAGQAKTDWLIYLVVKDVSNRYNLTKTDPDYEFEFIIEYCIDSQSILLILT